MFHTCLGRLCNGKWEQEKISEPSAERPLGEVEVCFLLPKQRPLCRTNPLSHWVQMRSTTALSLSNTILQCKHPSVHSEEKAVWSNMVSMARHMRRWQFSTYPRIGMNPGWDHNSLDTVDPNTKLYLPCTYTACNCCHNLNCPRTNISNWTWITPCNKSVVIKITHQHNW